MKVRNLTKRILWLFCLIVSLHIVCYLALAQGLYAQQLRLIGNNFDLSNGLTIQRVHPFVAYNSVDNEYHVVWADLRNVGTTGNDIFAQRVSAAGSLLGANFPVIEFADSQMQPTVAHNSIDNEYLVAWKTQQPGFFNDVRGRRLSNTGMLLDGDFFILGDDPAAAGGGGGNKFSIAYNPTANEYLVTGSQGGGISGRRVANNGTLLGGAEIIISATSCCANNGQVAYNPNTNEYLATWRDSIETERNLKGRRISASGTLLGNVIVISPLFPESGRYSSSVAFDSTNDRYLVVFGLFQGNEILGQFVSSSGQLIGTNFTIATSLASRASPYVAHSSIDNAFFVVWREGNDIVGQLLSESGSMAGDSLTIARGTAAGDPRHAANLETGEFLVVWSDSRSLSQGEEDLFAQLIGITHIVNDLVTFIPISSTYNATADTTGCPEGVVGTFSFDARLENTSSDTLSNLMCECTTLTNGNLFNADGGPGGKGASLTIPMTGGYSDGKLSSGEYVDVHFEICLTQWRRFNFFVDVLGMPN